VFMAPHAMSQGQACSKHGYVITLVVHHARSAAQARRCSPFFNGWLHLTP
jgi:hypothetical protein